MNKNPKQEFTANLHGAWQYHVSTVSQFNLLMEAAGYTINNNKEKGEFVYYKNGEAQGSITEEAIKEHIAEMQAQSGIAQYETDKKRQKQIAAIIKKYAKQYDTILIKSQFAGGAYADEKSKWKSELSEELKKKFGLEFVFFAGKNTEKPYGYSIIDHSHKTVYKGSDVMKLNDLLDLHETENTRNTDMENIAENRYDNTEGKIYSTHEYQNRHQKPDGQKNNGYTPETAAESGFQPYDRENSLAGLLEEIVDANDNQRSKNVKQDDGTYNPEEEKKRRQRFY
jgi:polyhydroxyalkanoate synthesis regulator phasin